MVQIFHSTLDKYQVDRIYFDKEVLLFSFLL